MEGNLHFESDLGAVLIVDDESANREILRDLLRDEGYEIVLACDGTEGLRKATYGIGIILLDIAMPRLDGITVCRHLKANPATAHIPVLFLSACPEKEIHEAALKAGACDFLAKPVQVSELRVKVNAARQVDPRLAPEIRRACYRQFVREGLALHQREEAGLDEKMDHASLTEA